MPRIIILIVCKLRDERGVDCGSSDSNCGGNGRLPSGVEVIVVMVVIVVVELVGSIADIFLKNGVTIW